MPPPPLAHTSMHTPTERPSCLKLTHRTHQPQARSPSLLASLSWLVRVGKDWEGWGLAQPLFPPSAGWLAPSCLAESASPAELRQPWLFWANSLSGLVSADAVAAAAAGARRLRAAANVADGGQGGRKEAGPVLRPLTGGDKSQGGWMSRQGSWAGGLHAQPGLWAHIGPRLTG